ncbi:MAG: hypothetical protein IPK75_10210 [Acidobacteria bacterium]|nr:hypothetical protein [Acidobacteriota bacterium]
MLRKITAAALACLWAAMGAQAQVSPDALTGLKAGDLIFKGAETGTGTRVAAGWSLGDKRWGHVGIVAAHPGGGFDVIHADTGQPGEAGEVRRVPLAAFLADVYTAGIYEVHLEGDQRKAYLAEAEAEIGLPFDRGFSLASTNAVYCSELVWRALSAGAGGDIQPEKTKRFGRVYISVSDISENPLVEEVAVIAAERPHKS